MQLFLSHCMHSNFASLLRDAYGLTCNANWSSKIVVVAPFKHVGNKLPNALERLAAAISEEYIVCSLNADVSWQVKSTMSWDE